MVALPAGFHTRALFAIACTDGEASLRGWWDWETSPGTVGPEWDGSYYRCGQTCPLGDCMPADGQEALISLLAQR